MEEVHKKFAEKYMDIVDNVKDSKIFATELFAKDATFVLGNFPINTGHEEIAAAGQRMYDMLEGLRHETRIIQSCTRVRGFVHYTLKDGRVLDPIPLASFFDLDPETLSVIKQYECFLDLSPLFVAIGLDITADEAGKVKLVPRATSQ